MKCLLVLMCIAVVSASYVKRQEFPEDIQLDLDQTNREVSETF